MKAKTKKRLTITLSVIGLLILAYFLGPKPNYPTFDGQITWQKIPLNDLETTLEQENAALPNLRDQCGSSVVWHNDSIQKTKYAVVFLHGFSACPFEGNPIVQDFAKEFGCNLYLHRLPQHGLDDDESFVDLTPKKWIESAKKAINIGANLGEKVIIMSSSTGGTLSTYLTAENEAANIIAAQFLYSPNFEIANPASFLMNNPWGSQILQQIEGGNYHYIKGMSEVSAPYWTTTYRIEGLVALQDLIEKTMTTATFEKIKSPVFIGYYYKNENEKDNIVSIDAMKYFYNNIQTPKNQKVIIPFSEVGGHVITNKYQQGGLEDVRKATFDFAQKTLFVGVSE
jgi:esterase/lipase